MRIENGLPEVGNQLTICVYMVAYFDKFIPVNGASGQINYASPHFYEGIFMVLCGYCTKRLLPERVILAYINSFTKLTSNVRLK